jgi:hypothetical protein
MSSCNSTNLSRPRKTIGERLVMGKVKLATFHLLRGQVVDLCRSYSGDPELPYENQVIQRSEVYSWGRREDCIEGEWTLYIVLRTGADKYIR